MIGEISACIIAKNEEKNLPRLLESIKGKFREIILVDTGSTDKTIEIANSYGCKVFITEWSGFADARNFATDKASGEWIWHFDADTQLEDSEYERFKTFFYLVDRNNFEGIGVICKNTSVDGKVKSYSTTVHIHKKTRNIRWIGKIHERVLNIERYDILIPPFMVKVLHHGYSLNSVQREKAKRNLKLIFDELRSLKQKNHNEYGINLFYAIQSYVALSSIEKREKNLKRAIRYIDKFEKIKDLFPGNSIFLKHFYVYSSSIYRNLGEFEKALDFVEEGLRLDKDYPDLLYLKGDIFENLKEYGNAIEYYLKFLNSLDRVRVEGFSVITDYMSLAKDVALKKLPLLIKDNKPEIVSRIGDLWKESRGFYLGILYFAILLDLEIDNPEKVLVKLSRLYPEEDVIFSLLGGLYAKDDPIRAEDYMKRAIELNPLNSEANLFFAQMYLKDEKYLDALNFYKNYLEITKDPAFLPKVNQIIEKLKNS